MTNFNFQLARSGVFLCFFVHHAAPCVFHVKMRVFNTLNAWSAQNADFRGLKYYVNSVTFLRYVFEPFSRGVFAGGVPNVCLTCA